MNILIWESVSHSFFIFKMSLFFCKLSWCIHFLPFFKFQICSKSSSFQEWRSNIYQENEDGNYFNCLEKRLKMKIASCLSTVSQKGWGACSEYFAWKKKLKANQKIDTEGAENTDKVRQNNDLTFDESLLLQSVQ